MRLIRAVHLGCALALVATAPAARAQDISGAAVAAAQNVLVSDLAPTLPRVGLAAWLRQLAGPRASLSWNATDCGEQTGNPALDRGRDMPLCAEVQVDLGGRRTVTLAFIVGTRTRGASGRPALYDGQLSESGGRGIGVPAVTAIPSVMTEAARLRQARDWVAAITPGMSRTDVERLMGRPPAEGGIVPSGSERYYLGWNVKIVVPYAGARVAGPAAVARGPFTMD